MVLPIVTDMPTHKHLHERWQLEGITPILASEYIEQEAVHKVQRATPHNDHHLLHLGVALSGDLDS